MACMIRSAILIESEIAATNLGAGGPPFQSANLRADKIDAAISRTRFRPSSEKLLEAKIWRICYFASMDGRQ
jgi:hypothetical protein